MLLATLLLSLVSSSSGAAPGSSATSQMVVEIDRMVYADGYYRADFVTSGVCAPRSDAVQVLTAACNGTPADASSGTVRMATLGFDASRRVDAGRADLPVLETAQGAAPQQWERVIVRVHEAGELRVEISGVPAEGFDPQPVPGTVSSGGLIAGRAVVWSIPNAEPGTYGFGVAFTPGAPAGFSGTYVPKVMVSRTVDDVRAIDHVGGPPPPPAGASVRRTSWLVMPQPIASASGPPIAGFQPFIPTDEALPASFEASAWLDGAGAYNATASGVVTASSVGLFEELAPGSVGVANTAAIINSRPFIPGADKVSVIPAVDRDPDSGEIYRFRHEVRTATPTSFEVPPHGPTAGTFWDGDAAIVGAAGGLGKISADGEPAPRNDEGAIRADWDGNSSVVWSGLWANNLPVGEPNALNYAKYKRDVENAVYEAAGYPGGLGPFPVTAMTVATIPIVADGGDIDTAREGAPFKVRVPEGHSFAGAGTFTFWMDETNYEFTQTSAADGVTIVPRMDPGGVWMESTRAGYDRDWSNLHVVAVFSNELGREFDGGMVGEAAVVVPEGVRASVDFLQVDGTTLHRRLDPGTWRVGFLPQRLKLVRVDATEAHRAGSTGTRTLR